MVIAARGVRHCDHHGLLLGHVLNSSLAGPEPGKEGSNPGADPIDTNSAARRSQPEQREAQKCQTKIEKIEIEKRSENSLLDLRMGIIKILDTLL